MEPTCDALRISLPPNSVSCASFGKVVWACDLWPLTILGAVCQLTPRSRACGVLWYVPLITYFPDGMHDEAPFPHPRPQGMSLGTHPADKGASSSLVFSYIDRDSGKFTCSELLGNFLQSWWVSGHHLPRRRLDGELAPSSSSLLRSTSGERNIKRVPGSGWFCQFRETPPAWWSPLRTCEN